MPAHLLAILSMDGTWAPLVCSDEHPAVSGIVVRLVSADGADFDAALAELRAELRYVNLQPLVKLLSPRDRAMLGVL
jgi:hypothetical protein